MAKSLAGLVISMALRRVRERDGFDHTSQHRAAVLLDGRYLLGQGFDAAAMSSTAPSIARPARRSRSWSKQNVADDPQYAERLRREAEPLQALWGTSVVGLLLRLRTTTTARSTW